MEKPDGTDHRCGNVHIKRAALIPNGTLSISVQTADSLARGSSPYKNYTHVAVLQRQLANFLLAKGDDVVKELRLWEITLDHTAAFRIFFDANMSCHRQSKHVTGHPKSTYPIKKTYCVRTWTKS